MQAFWPLAAVDRADGIVVVARGRAGAVVDPVDGDESSAAEVGVSVPADGPGAVPDPDRPTGAQPVKDTAAITSATTTSRTRPGMSAHPSPVHSAAVLRCRFQHHEPTVRLLRNSSLAAV